LIQNEIGRRDRRHPYRRVTLTGLTAADNNNDIELDGGTFSLVTG